MYIHLDKNKDKGFLLLLQSGRRLSERVYN